MGEYFGYRFLFFSYAGLALLSAVWAFMRIPETSANQQRTALNGETAEPGEPKKNTSYLSNYNFILISMVALLTLVTIGGTQATLIPLVGYENLSLSEGQVGVALTVIAIMQVILSPLAGSLSDKFGRKRLILPGGVITVLGLVMFMHGNSYWFFLLCALILGVGRGIGAPVPTAYVSDLALKGDYEGTLAAFRSISDLGWVIGPLLCGYLKDAAGLTLPFYVTAGLLMLTVTLFGAFGKETITPDTRMSQTTVP